MQYGPLGRSGRTVSKSMVAVILATATPIGKKVRLLPPWVYIGRRR